MDFFYQLCFFVPRFNLIAVKLVQEEAIVDLLWSYHGAPGVALYDILLLFEIGRQVFVPHNSSLIIKIISLTFSPFSHIRDITVNVSMWEMWNYHIDITQNRFFVKFYPKNLNNIFAPIHQNSISRYKKLIKYWFFLQKLQKQFHDLWGFFFILNSIRWKLLRIK